MRTCSALHRFGAWALCAAALAASGCAANRQYFVPTERVQGETLSGYKQAFYPLSGPSGSFGEAKLWTHGSYRGQDGGTVIQVAFSLHNTSGAPITLRAADVRLRSVRTDAGVLNDVAPADPKDLTVAPQQIGDRQFHFLLPADIAPGEIEAFVLAWAVHGPDGVYRQRTLFAERVAGGYPPPPYGYPCWPYGPYDCFYGPPYYWGPYPYPYWPPGPPPFRHDRSVVHPHHH